jgi:hypothetical protein
MKILPIALLLALGSVAVSPAQQEPTVDDADIHVTHFEEATFPLLARQTNLSGAVVVRASLNDSGGVVSATAISGHKLLIPVCLGNIKLWRFKPNAAKVAIVIYRFDFFEQFCAKGAKQKFVFSPPNIATVTGCPVPVET